MDLLVRHYCDEEAGVHDVNNAREKMMDEEDIPVEEEARMDDGKNFLDDVIDYYYFDDANCVEGEVHHIPDNAHIEIDGGVGGVENCSMGVAAVPEMNGEDNHGNPDENNGVDEAEDGVKNDDYFYYLVVHHLETVAGVQNTPDEAEDNDQEEEVREVAVHQIRKVEGLLVASLDVALLF